jgi:PASTA domain
MRFLGSVTTVAAALAAAALALAVPTHAASSPSARAVDFGTLSVCNQSGSPPIAIALTYTLNAPGSAGGSQVQTASVGTCTAQVWFPVGAQVTVLENVPTSFAVTAITIGGGQSTLTQTVLGAGEAVVTIGTGQSLLTFTTKAPGPPPAAACVVPRVIGLTLTAARNAVTHAHCRVGSVSRIYSSRIPKGGVTSVKPRQGAHLAHNAKIRLYVSRGHKP